MMGKNEFDLDLRLYPSSSSSSPPHHYHTNFKSEAQWPQQITIFNNGSITVCDLTELQARAMLWLASREMEERIKNENTNNRRIQQSTSEMISAAAIRSLRDVYFIPGLSMKRSLERFFQKRRHRIRSASPYAH